MFFELNESLLFGHKRDTEGHHLKKLRADLEGTMGWEFDTARKVLKSLVKNFNNASLVKDFF